MLKVHIWSKGENPKKLQDRSWEWGTEVPYKPHLHTHDFVLEADGIELGMIQNSFVGIVEPAESVVDVDIHTSTFTWTGDMARMILANLGNWFGWAG